VAPSRGGKARSMDLKNLQRKAKQLIDKRGGNESLKEDA
jgi:hypothetical protein